MSLISPWFHTVDLKLKFLEKIGFDGKYAIFRIHLMTTSVTVSQYLVDRFCCAILNGQTSPKDPPICAGSILSIIFALI